MFKTDLSKQAKLQWLQVPSEVDEDDSGKLADISGTSKGNI
jgi:hypothetical protein